MTTTTTATASPSVPPPVTATSCPADPEPGLPAVATGVVTMPDAVPHPAKVEVELVSSEHDTMRGLMYRTSMAEDHGMLFVLPREDHSFWMHNTCISLDLLYIDDGIIVGIVDSAPKLNDGLQGVGRLSSRVLEVNAGWCRRHGVRAGQRVVLPDVSR
jgi:uncharacterized membrane protein (UPF0127 family)